MLSIKTFLPRTLLGRSLLILVTPVILIQVIAAYIFFDRHWDKMTARMAFGVAGEIASVADGIDGGMLTPEQFEIVAALAARNLDLLMTLEPDGKLHKGGAKPIGVKHSIIVGPLSDAMEGRVRRPFDIGVSDRENWIEVSVQLDGGLFRVSLPQRRLFSSSGYIFLLWMTGSSLALLAVAVLFMRNQIRPIRKLSIAAERFGRGLDIPASFKPEGAYEVRQAGRAFVEMHERIRRQIQQRTAMLAGVSHDLRTPLTRMKLQAAMLDSTPDVESLKADIADMERMLNAYLEFARGEGGEASARTDLKDILERVASGVRRQGAAVDLEAAGDLTIMIRPVAIERCVANIAGNARKYGTHIKIAAARTEDNVTVTIDDNGPGIPEDQYAEMFKPFVRGEPSRNPATGGVGLGLPIAQDIVNAHGGRIWLEKSPLGGLRVVITLPV